MSDKYERLEKRAWRILEIARGIAEKQGWQVRGQIEEMSLHRDYAEPGYSSRSGIIATGNWNNVDRYDSERQAHVEVSNLPERIGKLFEKLDIECEWSDEWTTCSDCGKLVRTSGDSYSWKPSYWLTSDSEFICHECVDPEAYLKALETDDECVTLDIDPAEHGYIKFNSDPYESGWHPGQNDSPAKIAKELQAKGIKRFVFKLDENSQFYSRFSVYIHESVSGVDEWNEIHERAKEGDKQAQWLLVCTDAAMQKGAPLAEALLHCKLGVENVE